jgi:ribosomal protein L22
MTTARRASANQRNAKKSTGPKSATGKARASRNARRHGLGAAAGNDPPLSIELKRIVDRLCGSNVDPALREQATIIAEAQILIRRVRAERIAIIKRYCKPPQIPDLDIRQKLSPYDKCVDAKLDARAGLRMSQRPKKSANLLAEVVKALKFEAQYREARQRPRALDEDSALIAALPELSSLERYERRACSRRRRAIMIFTSLYRAGGLQS